MSNSASHFISFADGCRDIKDSGLRILQQALETDLFDSATCYDAAFLKSQNINGADLIDENTKGFGFWIWKPLLIQYVLRNVIAENDTLIYCDAGSEIVNNVFSRRTFVQLLSHLQEQDIVAFDTSALEYHYTKKMCLDLLNLKNNELSNQVAATTVLLKNTHLSRKFVDSWVDIATQKNGLYINDSLGSESEEFREHRYDQSIFSVLYKNANMKSLKLISPRYKLSEPRVRFLEKVMHNNLFFWQIRNRTGASSVSWWQSSTAIAFLLLPVTLSRPAFRVIDRTARQGVSWFLHSYKRSKPGIHR
jgi:hypothetical protein